MACKKEHSKQHNDILKVNFFQSIRPVTFSCKQDNKFRCVAVSVG